MDDGRKRFCFARVGAPILAGQINLARAFFCPVPLDRVINHGYIQNTHTEGDRQMTTGTLYAIAYTDTVIWGAVPMRGNWMDALKTEVYEWADTPGPEDIHLWDSDELKIETGVTLTDEVLDSDNAIFSTDSGRCGYLIDEAGETWEYAVLRPTSLTPEYHDDTVTVRDLEGGIWWPNDEASAEIMAAADPEKTAMRICDNEPMRGEWRT